MFSIDSDLDARDLRIAVLASRFNPEISQRLVRGCQRQLAELRCERVDLHFTIESGMNGTITHIARID